MKLFRKLGTKDNIIFVAFQPVCRCGDTSGKEHPCFFKEAMDRHPAGKQR